MTISQLYFLGIYMYTLTDHSSKQDSTITSRTLIRSNTIFTHLFSFEIFYFILFSKLMIFNGLALLVDSVPRWNLYGEIRQHDYDNTILSCTK